MSRSSRALSRALAHGATCALLLLSAHDALARPGGGGGYHGGGGGGGGYHGGGGFGGGGYHGGGGFGGGGGGLFFLPGSAFEVVVLIVFLVIYIAIAQRRRTAMDGGAYAALEAAQNEGGRDSAAASFAALQARDPALTLASVEARVHRMNELLVTSWCAGDMRPARPVVSDGVYSRFSVQLGLMRGEDRRNVMKDARVLSVTLEGVESAAPLDVVHLRVEATARDVEVRAKATDDEIARALSRAGEDPYTEIWSLVRRHGATTTRDAGALGRACSSCGAPIAEGEGEMIKCRYCNALLCSGEHDWVLAEITQVEEWHPSGQSPRGLDVLRQRDPELSRESIEDRASYLFWKWIEAGRLRSLAPLRKCATPELLARDPRLAAVADARQVAVGGADLLFALPASAGDSGQLERAYVKVFWSAALGGGKEPMPVQSVLRLVRKSGVATRAAMTALICNACGASIGESDTPTCDHCGALLAAGDQTWVLDAVERPGVLESDAMQRPPAPGLEDAPVPQWLVPNVIDPRDRLVLFAQMAAMIAADGEVTRRERSLLEMVARRWGIAPEMIDRAIRGGAAMDATIATTNPLWFLAGLVAAALADGKIDARERAMLERACDALRLPREELTRQIQGCRERLAREASRV